jgi:hypothetical protein
MGHRDRPGGDDGGWSAFGEDLTAYEEAEGRLEECTYALLCDHVRFRALTLAVAYAPTHDASLLKSP